MQKTSLQARLRPPQNCSQKKARARVAQITTQKNILTSPGRLFILLELEGLAASACRFYYLREAEEAVGAIYDVLNPEVGLVSPVLITIRAVQFWF